MPVAPAAHYLIGGDRHRPRRAHHRCPGLLAVGECSCTGLHGANRLASNSLSECFVFGRAARAAVAARGQARAAACRRRRTGASSRPSEATRDAVWAHAGPRRDAAGLERLLIGRPISARADDRARARSSAGVARRARAHPITRCPTRAWTGVHLVVGADGGVRTERWI